MEFQKIFYTLCGVIALLAWTTNIYFLKCTLDIYGNVAGIGLMYLFGGLIGLSIDYISNGYTLNIVINKEYTIASLLLMMNFISSSLSFGLSPANEVLLQVIIVNDLWVIFLNIFLVLILKYKITNKILFAIGIVSGVFGIMIGCVGFNLNKINFVKYFDNYYYCYLLGLLTAISWSYYTIYLKKYKNINDNHLFLTMFLTGLFMTVFSFVFPQFNKYNDLDGNIKTIGLMFYEIIFPSYLAYYLWNISYKHGNAKTLSNISILAPLLNIIMTSILYGIDVIYSIILAAILLVISMGCCKYSLSSSIKYQIIKEINHIDV
jgi:drug/metabolite transporter (DMT)-like permease